MDLSWCGCRVHSLTFRLPWLLPMLLLACGRPDDELRVVGGSDAQRAAVIEAWHEMMAPCSDPPAIARVRIGPMRNYGRYNPLTRQIRVNELGQPDYLLPIVRHELCHAFDVQYDLNTPDEPFWALSVQEGQPRSQSRRRREAFAAFCEVGPAAWALLDGDDASLAPLIAARAAMFDRLPLVAPATLEVVGSAPRGAGQRFVEAIEADDRSLALLLADASGGESVAVVALPAGAPEVVAEGDPLVVPSPWSGEGVWLHDGASVGLASWRMPSGEMAKRRLHIAADGSLLALPVEAVPVIAHGALWLVVVASDRIEVAQVVQ